MGIASTKRDVADTEGVDFNKLTETSAKRKIDQAAGKEASKELTSCSMSSDECKDKFVNTLKSLTLKGTTEGWEVEDQIMKGRVNGVKAAIQSCRRNTGKTDAQCDWKDGDIHAAMQNFGVVP